MDSKCDSTSTSSKDGMGSIKKIQLPSTKPETLSDTDSEQKKKEVDDDPTPGPAAYRTDYWAQQSIYRSSPKYSFGHKVRDENFWGYRNYSPGPGAYYIDLKYKGTGPAYSFGQRHSMKKSLFYVYNRD